MSLYIKEFNYPKHVSMTIKIIFCLFRISVVEIVKEIFHSFFLINCMVFKQLAFIVNLIWFNPFLGFCHFFPASPCCRKWNEIFKIHNYFVLVKAVKVFMTWKIQNQNFLIILNCIPIENGWRFLLVHMLSSFIDVQHFKIIKLHDLWRTRIDIDNRKIMREY